MRPSAGTTPEGPLLPQYLTPLIVRKSYAQSYASTSKATTTAGLAGRFVTVHDSLRP